MILEEVINYEIEMINATAQIYEDIYPEGYYSDQDCGC